jgi:hypothetical protein
MTPRNAFMSRGASVCPKKMLAATITITITTTLKIITTPITIKTFYRHLLSHDSKEGFDEQRRFRLSQENVSSITNNNNNNNDNNNKNNINNII